MVGCIGHRYRLAVFTTRRAGGSEYSHAPAAAQDKSIVVASTATNWFGHEGSILRFVFGHSIALACLVGVLVMLQAYVFTGMIVH